MLDFPVLKILSTLNVMLANQPVVILQAPPGAGKSTVLPLYIMNEPWLGGKKIVMLEPRRLAARSVAMRLASQLQEKAGQKIGYRIRFENKISAATQVEVVTEGILTRMLQSDIALEGVGLVIFDEFHERSLQADLSLSLCLQVQSIVRNDLRILIMSATLDGEVLSAKLNHAPVITSLGRQYPVVLKYFSYDVDAPIALRMIKAIHKAIEDEVGDILVFLPGAGEINRVQSILDEEEIPLLIHPLYGDLPFKKQQEAILPHPLGKRKIILATSIAETSLTIEGIQVVIDCGLSRVPKFDPRSGLTRLETIRVSKDSADQRAGRAGRLGPGVCYRLWSESIQTNLLPNRTPEILEADLAPLLLELGQWGVKDIQELTWITSPPSGAVSQAKVLLHQLGALEENKITPRGKEMLGLPTHPRIAHMLLEAKHSPQGKEYLSLATDLAAVLEERDPLTKESGVDVVLRVEALRKYRDGQKVFADRGVLERIEKLASNWRKLLKADIQNTAIKDADVGRLLVAAYPERIAQQTDKHSERYKLANGRMVKLPQHDPLLRETWLCIAQLDMGKGEGKIFLAAVVNPSDLKILSQEKETVRWDDQREMVVGSIEKQIGSLVLERKPAIKISDEARLKILGDIIQSKGLKILGWGEDQETWQARVMSLRAWRPNDGWPNVCDEKLLESVNVWLPPFVNSITKQTELEKLDLLSILNRILPWELNNRLDALVPSHLKVPSGSMIQLNYFSDGSPPMVEVRLQEMFGLLETPTVNEGRNKVTLHLLSPGYKPVQVTQDLKSFWQTTYHEVRKTLRMRYPRHHWPEDPFTAEAVRGAKKRV